jgi:hypothetical protein
MEHTPCPHEPDVIRAARGKKLAGELPAAGGHAETCESCREALRVAGALRELAALNRPTGPLPTAGQLWWRAEVIRRLAGNPGEREIRPAVWAELVGVAVAFTVLLLFVTLQASSLMGLLAGREALDGALVKLLAVTLLPLAVAGLMGFLLARRV